MDLGKPLTQRRRSERVSESLPVVIRGIDLLGQPFEERTSTLNFNLHGCRYASKHHLPKNTWVTLELPRDPRRRSVRARVAWIQRPHSVREFFQIAVELESPGNIWGFEPAPGDWVEPAAAPETDLSTEAIPVKTSADHTVTLASILEKHAAAPGSDSIPAAADMAAVDPPPDSGHPLPRELADELRRHTDEHLARMSDEFQRTRASVAQARDEAASDLAALRKEQRSASEIAARLEQLRAEIELGVASRVDLQTSSTASAHVEAALAACKQHLDRETALARDQWAELLQSSLDSGMKRLAERLAERSQEALREAERAAAQIEARIAPRLDRVPELVRELETHQTQVEESLRLHRERLRQLSEVSQRDVSAQAASAVSELRGQCEAARTESLLRHAAELNESSARASHAATESMARTSEQTEQQVRAHLGSLAEQSLSFAGAAMEGKAEEAVRTFSERLGEESTARAIQAREQIEASAAAAISFSAQRLDEAAEIAAASFGQVLRGVAERESAQFVETSRSIVTSGEADLRESSARIRHEWEASAGASLEGLRSRMAAQLEQSMQDGRAALAGEFAVLLEGFRAERDSWRAEWAASLDQLSTAAAEQYRSRLHADGESWMSTSVQRLNEHGQSVIETLMLSADAALRDSCSKIFEGLAGALRERSGMPGITASGIAGFAPSLNRDVPEAPIPHNEAASGQVTA